VHIMRSEGHTFPALKESDAMFAADSPPTWADGESCHRCRTLFTVMTRKVSSQSLFHQAIEDGKI